MAASSVYLLLILLVFSQIVILNAVPLSRTRNLLHEPQEQDLVAAGQGTRGDKLEEQEMINGRMDLENTTNDYPGSGANSRHIPKPPLGRS